MLDHVVGEVSAGIGLASHDGHNVFRLVKRIGYMACVYMDAGNSCKSRLGLLVKKALVRHSRRLSIVVLISVEIGHRSLYPYPVLRRYVFLLIALIEYRRPHLRTCLWRFELVCDWYPIAIMQILI